MQRMRRSLLGALAGLLATSSVLMAQDLPTRLKKNLAAHPRLMLDESAAKTLAKSADPRIARLRARVIAEADTTLALPPLTRTLTGRRLLAVSRDALSRIGAQSLAYRLTGDKKYADAARQNMLAAAGFDDFNPSHYLDVAEMSAALGLGYDWLFAELSDADRATIRTAILDKGFTPSFTDPPPYWAKGGNNWNQVCNGGLAAAALAIADEAPEPAQRVLECTLAGLPVVMAHYGPDGAYPEGAMYWAYGTTYNVLAIASLQSALGDDFGLLAEPGFLKTADYRLHITGPSGKAFSYADGTEDATRDPAAAQFFLAGQRKDPSLLFNDLHSLDALLDKSVGPKDYQANHWMLLMWLTEGLTATAPKATHYAGVGDTPVATHRSSWERDATFVGIVASSPGGPHGHMDTGSFALDALGVRWASDLGLQNYNSLEQKQIKLWDTAQEADRWRVYRIGQLSHNILTVNGWPLNVKGRASIVRTARRFTIVDTSSVYAGQLASTKRGVFLRDDKTVRLQDEIVGTPAGPSSQPTSKPSTQQAATTQPFAPTGVRWAMLTTADIDIAADGIATLKKSGQQLRATIVSPAGATWKIVSTEPPNDYDEKNPGTRLLTFETTVGASESQTLVVDFTPGNTPADSQPVTPLDRW
jgi:hypothetical protein